LNLLNHLQQELSHQESNQTQNGVRHRQKGLGAADEVNQSRNLADGVYLVRGAPQTTVHRVKLEQLQRILDALGRAVRRVRLERKNSMTQDNILLVKRTKRNTGCVFSSLTTLVLSVTSEMSTAAIRALVVSCTKISYGLKYGMPA